MKTTKKFLVALLALILLIGTIPASRIISVQAATSAYTMTYEANKLVVYYEQDSAGGIQAVPERQVKYGGNNVIVGGTTIATNKKTDVAPVWYGDYLTWPSSDDYFTYWNFNTKGTPVTGVPNVATLEYDPNGIKNNGYLSGVKLTNGKTISFAEACVYSGGSTTTPSTPGTTTPPATQPSVPTTPTTPTNSKVDIEVLGTSTVYTFSGNVLKVDGSTFNLNGYMISERCISGVRYKGIDAGKYVVLHEDTAKITYIFDVNNPFNPTVLKTGSTPVIKLNSSTGYLETIDGLPLSTWMALGSTIEIPAYAINKVNYSSFYKGETTHLLEVSGNVLMFDGKAVKNIKYSVPEIGGVTFDATYIYCVDGSQEWKAAQSDPTNWSLNKQNVLKSNTSSTNGFRTDVTRLSEKRDYAKNSTKLKVLLYQTSKLSYTGKINKNKTSATLNGMKFKTISKAQKKKGITFSAIYFTEQNEIVLVYSNGAKYKAPVSNPYSQKKWNVNLVINELGFAEGV